MSKFLLKQKLLKTALFIVCSLMLVSCVSKKVVISYAVISVPEEGGIKFERITSDDVISPGFKVTGKRSITSEPTKGEDFTWHRWKVIDVSPDGKNIAYINYKNETANVMIKSATQGGGSTQRTFRTDVRGLTYSPDGTKICYAEYRDGGTGIYMMDSQQGTTVQRISPSGSQDIGPSMTKGGRVIFFDRWEGDYNYSLWSYDTATGLFSNYSRGFSLCVNPTNDNIIYCARYTFDDDVKVLRTKDQIFVSNKKIGRSEIWKLDIEKGLEEVLLSEKGIHFSCPQVSPDGKWILLTAANKSNNDIWNTNLFVVRIDGTGLTQLTYHPGNDMSGVWAPDGKSIYFVSQRGTEKGLYNVWKMNFPL